MIIDTHTHIGRSGSLSMKPSDLIKAMGKYKINFSLVSSISACEYDTYHRPIKSLSQIDANTEILNFVKKHPHRLAGLFWIKPNVDGYSNDIEKFMQKNKGAFVGFKSHPYYSMLDVTQEQYKPYFELAQKLKLPFVIHSAFDEYSLPKYVFEIAKKYPDVNMVMVHMGLYTNNKEAIELIKQLPNLYGDTTWVKVRRLEKAISKLGSEKILFGTDAIVGGIDTYNKYQKTFDLINNHCMPEEAENIYFRNAIKLFNLDKKLFDL